MRCESVWRLKSGPRSHGWRLLALLVLAFVYLHPGGSLLLSARTDQVLSDGTDPTTLPYAYSIVIDHLQHRPSLLLFGAVPTERLNAPDGFAIWFPWLEKIVVAAFSPVVVLEQLSTLYVWLILTLTGMCFYALGTTLGWSRPLAFALALCWAFNAYTRARAGVHMALAGLYHLPLLVLGLHLVVNKRDRKSLGLAMLCFLGAATTAHYYLIITAFLTPFWMIYLLSSREWAGARTALLSRAALALLPAVLLLSWSFLKPVPGDTLRPEATVRIPTGAAAPGEIHSFMHRFAARPVDFLTGEMAPGAHDLNPLRGALSRHVLRNIGDGAAHERANGIRWLVLAAFVWALWRVAAGSPRAVMPSAVRRPILAFAGLAGFCFWLALSPSIFGADVGPSRWLYALVPQLRVPSRSGPFAHFGVLMAVGFFLQWRLFDPRPAISTDAAGARPRASRFIRLLASAGVLPLLALGELPPLLNDMPVARIVPQRDRGSEACGLGLYFPYVSGGWALTEYYSFLQSMRGSRCQIINAPAPISSPRDPLFMTYMPLSTEILQAIQSDQPELKAGLVRLARCVPLEWIVFDPRVPEHWARELCGQLGWQMPALDTCRSQERGRAMIRLPEACFD